MAIVKLNLSGHKNDAANALGFTFPGILQVNLEEPQWREKVLGFLVPLVTSGDTVWVILPGLAPLAGCVLVALHGLTGHFPRQYTLIQGENGFYIDAGYDLHEFRNQASRKKREKLIDLTEGPRPCNCGSGIAWTTCPEASQYCG